MYGSPGERSQRAESGRFGGRGAAARGWHCAGAWVGAALLALWGAPPAAWAQGQVTALRGARIYTAAGPVIEGGVLLIEGGKIRAVGSAAQVQVPAGAQVRDLAGKVLIPGIVDSHSHIGISPRPSIPAHGEGNEGSGAVQSRLRALDGIWPDDPGIAMARAGGVTTANVMPGSGNVVSGQTLYLKLRGDTVEQMRLELNGIAGGMKMANGENPKREDKVPETRMAEAALQRDLFVRAQAYAKSIAKYKAQVAGGKKDAEEPKRDIELEPMLEVLDGRRIVHHHTHRSDDIATILRLQQEFGFKVVLHHVTEGWRLPELLAQRNIPVSLIALDSPGGKAEATRYRLDYAGILERAGVKVAIHSDDSITDSRLLLRSAALFVREGMSEDGALRGLTLESARMLGLESRVGSLEVGKDADFALLSGPPFSVYTQVLETWIDGVRVFDRSQPLDRAYATGGFRLVEGGR